MKKVSVICASSLMTAWGYKFGRANRTEPLGDAETRAVRLCKDIQDAFERSKLNNIQWFF